MATGVDTDIECTVWSNRCRFFYYLQNYSQTYRLYLIGCIVNVSLWSQSVKGTVLSCCFQLP